MDIKKELQVSVEMLLYLNNLTVEILDKYVGDIGFENTPKAFGIIIHGHSDSILKLYHQSNSISSLLVLIRAQFEAFAIFYRLFVIGSKEEQYLRFWLWKLKGVRERLKFNPEEMLDKSLHEDNVRKQLKRNEHLGEEKINKIKESLHKKAEESMRIDRELIEEIKKQQQVDSEVAEELSKQILNSQEISIIEEKFKNHLVKRAAWLFSLEEIQNWKINDKPSRNEFKEYTSTQLTQSTSIPRDLTLELYHFLSMHIHNNYISIIQNNQLTKEDYINTAMLSLKFSKIVLTHYIYHYLCIHSLSVETFTPEPSKFEFLKKQASLPD